MESATLFAGETAAPANRRRRFHQFHLWIFRPGRKKATLTFWLRSWKTRPSQVCPQRTHEAGYGGIDAADD